MSSKIYIVLGIILLALVSAWFLSSQINSGFNPGPGIPLSDALEGTQWHLVAYRDEIGEIRNVAQHNFMIKFKDSAINGNFCNTFMGTYELRDDILTAKIPDTTATCIHLPENAIFGSLKQGTPIILNPPRDLQISGPNLMEFYFQAR